MGYSKKYIGIVATLVLAILLSQGQMMDFLMNTFFGRALLLAFIGFISYTHKVIGLVAVLCVVLALNQNDQMVYSYNPEGSTFSSAFKFEGFTGKVTNKASKKTPEEKTSVVVASSSSATTAGSAETFKGREGFCMTDRESTIQRGKQSNVVPVSKDFNGDDVSPSDANAFSGEFSLF